MLRVSPGGTWSGGMTPALQYQRGAPATHPGIYRRWHRLYPGRDLDDEAEWLASEYHVPVRFVASFRAVDEYGEPCVWALAEYEQCPTCGNPQ